MLISQIRNFVIMPALKLCNLWCESAEILLTGTLMMETNAVAIIQNHGPALGFFQIEPETHEDIKLYLSHPASVHLLKPLLECCYFSNLPNDSELISNIKYSCLIARLIYFRNPERLPDQEDREELAHMYKRIYNTSGGKADIDKCLEVFKSIPCNLP